MDTCSRIEGPNKEPPHGSVFQLECHPPQNCVGTFEEVTEGADTDWSVKAYDIDEDDGGICNCRVRHMSITANGYVTDVNALAVLTLYLHRCRDVY